MFVRREALMAINGIPDGPTLAGSELCRHLRKLGRLALADATVSASSQGAARRAFAARTP